MLGFCNRRTVIQFLFFLTFLLKERILVACETALAVRKFTKGRVRIYYSYEKFLRLQYDIFISCKIRSLKHIVSHDLLKK